MKTFLVAILLGIMFGGVAFAAPTINSSVSSAQTSSSSVAIGNMAAPTANSAANSVANAKGGAAQSQSHSSSVSKGGAAQSSSSSAGGTSNATGGTSNANGGTSNATGGTSNANGGTSNATGGRGVGSVKVGGVRLTQHFAGSKIPAPLPIVSVPGVPVPQIFGRLNAPTNMKGIPLTEWFETACDTTATRAHPLKDERFEKKYVFGGRLDVSGDTTVTFSPSQKYFWAQQYPPYKVGHIPPFIHPIPVQSVNIITPEQAQARKYVCLGLLTVVSNKKGLGFSGIISDARVAPLGYMEGYKKISLVLVPTAVAAAVGVQTEGKSFSIIPTFVKMASSALTGGGAGASISGGEGATYAAARIGAVFVVFSAPPTASPYGKMYTVK